jgi:hypothetical protein
VVINKIYLGFNPTGMDYRLEYISHGPSSHEILNRSCDKSFIGF